MRTYFLLAVTFLAVAAAVAGDIKVITVRGDVQVRRGVHEQWQTAAAGDVLKPEDSIRLEKRSSAVILLNEKERFDLPAEMVIDFSDLRRLTQQDLLLMLAMERVRSIGGGHRDDDLTLPRTSTVHGANRGELHPALPPGYAPGALELNGTNFLYEHGFYATCILKSKQVFRLNPVLLKVINARMRVASALERMSLTGEAAEEYSGLLSEQIPPAERSLVEQKLAELKKAGNH